MKKIIALALIVCASFSVQVNAQAPKDGAKKEKKEKKPKADKAEKADKDAAKAAKDAEKAAKKAEKDAAKAAKEAKAEKPEKKEKVEKAEKAEKKEKKEKVEKVEKEAKKVADKNPTVKPEPKGPKKVNSATEKAAAGDDKVVGKDDKGRTIYEGPRGGRYYINANGNKSYVSQK